MSYYPYLNYLFDKIIITDARPQKRAFFSPKILPFQKLPFFDFVFIKKNYTFV